METQRNNRHCIQSFKCVSCLNCIMFSKSSQNIYVLVDLKMKHLPLEHFWVLGMWTARKHPLKIISRIKKKKKREQFIILIIVFIAHHCVSVCSHKSGDFEAACPAPTLSLSLFNGPDGRSTPPPLCSSWSSAEADPFCPTDRS